MNQSKKQIVTDAELGEILFPAGDNVMAPIINRDGIWEKNEVLWLRENISPGDNCINVGANVGYFSILMSQLTGENGSVSAFEPNPEVIPFFRKNIDSRNLKNVKLYEYAAGNRKGFQTLYLNRNNFGDSRMYNPKSTVGGGSYRHHGFNRIPRRRIVRIVTLDSVVKQKVDVVLIDAQGYDHQVLLGMQEIIARDRPKILTEFTPQWLSDLGDDPLSILKLYMSWGYMLGSTDFESSANAQPEEIMEEIGKLDTYFANLTLTPKPLI